jgi:hypothetical protein
MSFWNLNSLDIKIEEIEEIIHYFIKIFNHSPMCDYKIYENVIDESCLNSIFCFCVFSMEDNNKSIEFYDDETEEKKIHELNGINIVYTKMKINLTKVMLFFKKMENLCIKKVLAQIYAHTLITV